MEVLRLIRKLVLRGCGLLLAFAGTDCCAVAQIRDIRVRDADSTLASNIGKSSHDERDLFALEMINQIDDSFHRKILRYFPIVAASTKIRCGCTSAESGSYAINDTMLTTAESAPAFFHNKINLDRMSGKVLLQDSADYHQYIISPVFTARNKATFLIIARMVKKYCRAVLYPGYIVFECIDWMGDG